MTGAERLTAYLKRQGQDQVSLARELGISQGYCSRLLSGHKRPSLVVAVRIERHCGIPASIWVASGRNVHAA